MNIFGEYVKRLRKKNKWTQMELAQKLLVDFTYISKIERGRASIPSNKILGRMATLFHVSETEIMSMASRVSTDIKDVILNDPLALDVVQAIPKMSAEQREKLVALLYEITHETTHSQEFTQNSTDEPTKP